VTSLQAKPLVSVVIPAFNRADLIGRAIDSVLQQTYAEFEITVVDDASTDNTAAVVGAIQDPRVRYLSSERNAGASAARNMGIHAASGDFVAFLDSDDVWMPNKLELQLSAIRRHPDWGSVVCYTQAMVDNGKTRELMPIRAKRDSEPVADYVLGHEGLIHTSSLMLSRKLAAGTLFPVDQKIHEDWDVFLRLEQKGVTWQFVAKPLMVWHNEPRQGRLTSLPYDLSLEWLKDHQSILSSRAIAGFMVKHVVRPLISDERRRVYALWLVLRAIMLGAVAPARGFRTMARTLMPKSIRMKLKRLMGRS
jgi:glycosyltransferase involved in cell wall biosynthesis